MSTEASASGPGIDPAALARTVEGAFGIRLSPADAARLAEMTARTGARLDAVAAGSLFDTEPAQMAATLERLAGGPRR